MPFTFLSHQAVILPCKIAWPHRFDGVALVIGSTAPDLSYLCLGTRLACNAHTLLTQGWFCLPVTLALTWFVRRHMIAVLAMHLPKTTPWRFRDYARVARENRPWLTTVASALVGSLSHIALDAFTHASGWVVRHAPMLRASVRLLVLPRTPVYSLLQSGGSVVGAALTLAMIYDIGRRGRVRTWCPLMTTDEPAPTPASAAMLWGASSSRERSASRRSSRR